MNSILIGLTLVNVICALVVVHMNKKMVQMNRNRIVDDWDKEVEKALAVFEPKGE